MTGRLPGESGRDEGDDSDGGREGRQVTGNPSEALLSLFNYHPSLALLITLKHTHTHRLQVCACSWKLPWVSRSAYTKWVCAVWVVK